MQGWSGTEMQEGSGTETQISQCGMGLVDALCAHREILRTEISFLRMEVKSRNLATIAGRIAYLESQNLLQQKSGSSVEDTNLGEVKVSLPYLLRTHEEVLDFHLHELLVLRYRIHSIVSIVRKFNIPISSSKIQKLRSMSLTLKRISLHIMESNSRKEKNALSLDDSRMESKALSSDDSRKENEKMALSFYKRHRDGWQSTWGSGSPKCGLFHDATTLSSMQFTRCTPRVFPFSATTSPALQVYSVEIAELNENLKWPLYVYGVVAARDTVDRNRNLLFCRSRANCQKVSQDDPFLHLTGPSRAIVAAESVVFEVELKVKYGVQFRDEAVLSCEYDHQSAYDDTPEIGSGCFTAKLCLEKLARAIQATIVSVHIEGVEQHFKYGGRVFCSSAAAPSEFVLIDCHGEMPSGPYGSICLTRNVVAVEVNGTLTVSIEAYSKSGSIGATDHINFPVKTCQTSDRECSVGNSRVTVVIAWSLLAMDKEDLMMQGYVSR